MPDPDQGWTDAVPGRAQHHAYLPDGVTLPGTSPVGEGAPVPAYVPTRSGGSVGQTGLDQWGNPATLRHAAPPTRSRRPVLVVAGAVVAVVALVLGFLVIRGRTGEPVAAAPAVTAPIDIFAEGYTTLTAPKHLPLAVGTPWGVRCAPVVIALEATAPDEFVAAASDIVDQANGAGLNVVLGDTTGGYDASKLTGAKVDGSNLRRAVVRVSAAVPPRTADGRPAQLYQEWAAKRAADGRHEYLTAVLVTMYLKAFPANDPLRRAAFRQVLAMSLGIASSTKPGSGLYGKLPARADFFTGNDLDALRTMSGCG